MLMSQYSKKLFGVALDPGDDPWSLQLKQAWMTADKKDFNRLSACSDPYDAVTEGMASVLEEQHIELAGKFPVPSWLWPKPKPSDLPLVTAQNMGNFFDSGELLTIIKQLQFFVTKTIFPGIPIMIGVDHSATAGVLSALAERYNPKRLSVVVLDRHFDAIPLSVRLEGAPQTNPNFLTGTPLAPPVIPVGYNDQFCCGNFWAYLMDAGVVLPENLVFIGVADYPKSETDPERDSYRQSYLGFEERGCRFFPQWQFKGQYVNALTRFLREKITRPCLYVSLDLDVGAYNSTYAARYMDGPGISRQNLLDIAGIIADGCRQRGFQLVGLDIMEFNMHFLGIETPEGVKDSTLALVGDFITALIST